MTSAMSAMSNRLVSRRRDGSRHLAAGILVAALVLVLAPLPPVASRGAAGLVVSAHAEDTSGGAHEGSHEGEAAEQHGEGEHTPSQAPTIDLKRLALQLLNFGVLVFILVKFGGAAINKALAARHRQLKADLTAAADLRAAAEAKLAKQEARLASLEQELGQMRLGFKAEAEAEKAQLIALAEERAQRIKAETAFLMEQQVREAEQKLRRESAESALSLAGEILRRSIAAPDQQRMLDTFVADVEQAPPGGGLARNGNGSGNGKEQGPPNPAREPPPPDVEGIT